MCTFHKDLKIAQSHLLISDSYTYEMAPVFNLMEKEVVQKMCELIGWSHGNGIFAPGGSISNLYGLLAARYHHYPETKEKGCLHLPQLTIFASDEVPQSCVTGHSSLLPVLVPLSSTLLFSLLSPICLSLSLIIQ